MNADDLVSRIVNAGGLSSRSRLPDLLRFLLGEVEAGRGAQLKANVIATAQFDQQIDPIVRVEMARLRKALLNYYKTSGSDDSVKIWIVPGSYCPVVEVEPVRNHAQGGATVFAVSNGMRKWKALTEWIPAAATAVLMAGAYSVFCYVHCLPDTEIMAAASGQADFLGKRRE
jgi:hypothetical protein